jgi:predicted nucleotidyltransferase
VNQPLLARVVDVLDGLGARHALIGAAALAAHGVARSTFDLDLLTTNPAVLDTAAWAGLSADRDVTVSVRRGDSDDPLAGIVRIDAGGERTVDVIVGRWKWQADALEAAQPVRIGDMQVRVVRPADLILLKLYAGGTQDLWDIEQLLAAVDDPGLIPDVDARLDSLPASAREAWLRVARTGP